MIQVFAEEREGTLPDASLEVICEGRRLADQVRGGTLDVVILGGRAGEMAPVAAEHGADRVFFSEDEPVARYSPEPFTAILAGLIAMHEPSVVLLAATDVGQDLAPRVAAKVRACLFPGCDGLEMSADGFLLARRLTHGRKVHVTARARDAGPQLATLEPGIAKIRKSPAAGRGTPPEFVRIDAGACGTCGRERVKVVGFIKADPATVDIADADRVVAGGKGVGGPEGFRLVRELADAVGAAVAGSRVAVDEGCIPRDRQIGQSGKSVSPALLISCGISGANAHVAGMREAKTIVAVNTDKNAPIFRLADLAVVGDVREILPALTKRIRNRES